MTMYFFIFFSLVNLNSIECMLWPKGVVHYTINKKDYDIHSQDIIMSALETLEKELCIKFFNTPLNYNATVRDKILFISNPRKEKNCASGRFNYTGSVVDMVIGYKCLNQNDIARMAIDMLKASVAQAEPVVNSYDLVKVFEEQGKPDPHSTIITPEDRNHINAHYHSECTSLTARVPSRRIGDDPMPSEMTAENDKYYEDKIWPLGIVLYYLDEKLRDTPEFRRVRYAMTLIEQATCIVFHESQPCAPLCPRGVIIFKANDGDDYPKLGMPKGEQELNLSALAAGTPGHVAHTLSCMLRVLGLHMMSNRFDRDNFVTVNWQYVDNRYKYQLEKAPREAWVASIPYDFSSATHAPANFHCADCRPGAANTVVPIQDFLWQRTIMMGHKARLSESDKKLIGFLYGKQCKTRFMASSLLSPTPANSPSKLFTSFVKSRQKL